MCIQNNIVNEGWDGMMENEEEVYGKDEEDCDCEEEGMIQLHEIDKILNTSSEDQKYMKDILLFQTFEYTSSSSSNSSSKFSEFIAAPLLFALLMNSADVDEKNKNTKIIHRYFPDHNDFDNFKWKVKVTCNVEIKMVFLL